VPLATNSAPRPLRVNRRHASRRNQTIAAVPGQAQGVVKALTQMEAFELDPRSRAEKITLRPQHLISVVFFRHSSLPLDTDNTQSVVVAYIISLL
jgi:hypothetical protein